MAYFDPNGREVTAADALSNGKLRSGYRQTINPGDYLSFDMLMMDAKPKVSETSIAPKLSDAAVLARTRDAVKYLRDNRYNNLGPMIIGDDGETPYRLPAGDKAYSEGKIFANRLSRFTR